MPSPTNLQKRIDRQLSFGLRTQSNQRFAGPEGARDNPFLVRRLAILCAILAGCGTTVEPPVSLSEGDAKGANVVLLTLDTTRADRLGAYGYEKARTPALDRLAREGILYADAVSPVPMTLPAHASILTGLDPRNHGVRHNGQYRLDDSATTLAEVLAENGYETAAFVSGFVLDSRYGLSQGFEHYDDQIDPLPGQPFSGLGERSAGRVTDAALAWFKSRVAERPLFLWVHYYDPHAEYRPPEEFREGDPYDGEIAYMDSQIARLIEAIETAGEPVLVIAAGDHGEAFGEHSEYGHSRLLYETTQRVPLLLWSPGSIPGGGIVNDAVVGLVDVFPTVLDLLDIPAPDGIDGVSLRLARERKDRALYLETLAPFLDNGWSPLQALRRHGDKYILAPKEEYYDLGRDPGELRNLYRDGDTTPLASDLAARLGGDPSPGAIAESAAKPDSEALKKLQALGYLSGPGPSTESGGELPDPKDMMPIQRLVIESRTLRREGRPEDALPKAREALRAAPQDLEALEEVGLVSIELDRLEDAEKALKRRVELKPSANINVLLAQILARTGRMEEGVALLELALELEPDNGGVLIARGDFFAEDGNYREALAWYERAKEVDPHRATAVADRRIVEVRLRASGS
jgi:arylsulfatase A-like enzyme